MLFGEPALVWDSFPIYSSRQGIRILLSREEPLPRRVPGYPNPILELDRVRKMVDHMPGASHVALGKILGLSGNWVGELLRLSRLPTEIQDYVRGLGSIVDRSQITGSDLRKIRILETKRSQISKFKALLQKRGLPDVKKS